jgi:hypothetical protein
MSHQQFSIHQEDIHFDATKPAVQSVQERPLMVVVVVRMRPLQWRDRVRILPLRLHRHFHQSRQQPTEKHGSNSHCVVSKIVAPEWPAWSFFDPKVSHRLRATSG